MINENYVNKAPAKIVELLDRKLDYVPGEVYRIGNSYFVKPVDKKKQGITTHTLEWPKSKTQTTPNVNEDVE